MAKPTAQTITIEIDPKDKIIYISNDGSSGCKYGLSGWDSVKDAVKEYLDDLEHAEQKRV